MFRRITAAALILAAATALLITAWPQLFGMQFLPIVDQVIALRAVAAGVAAGLLVIVLILVLAVRPFRRLGAAFAVMLLAFIAVTGAVLATRGYGDGPLADKQDGDLTVLAWNTLGDAPGARAIADLALSTGADIVSLPETTEETAIEAALLMKEQGRPMWVNHIAFDQVSKARSTSLLTSTDLGEYSIDVGAGSTSVVPTIVATPDDGTGPTIIAAHPVAPIPDYLDSWRADLEWLRGACTGDDIIVAGDLNSTIDHYGRLANTPGATIGDCVDAAAATGSAAVGTWPADIPSALGAPIDHVMATPNWTARSVEVIRSVDDLGSDHRPIVARLTLTE